MTMSGELMTEQQPEQQTAKAPLDAADVVALLRSPEYIDRKVRRYLELLEVGRELAMAGFRARYPEATDEQLRELWRQRLARSRAEKWGGNG